MPYHTSKKSTVRSIHAVPWPAFLITISLFWQSDALMVLAILKDSRELWGIWVTCNDPVSDYCCFTKKRMTGMSKSLQMLLAGSNLLYIAGRIVLQPLSQLTMPPVADTYQPKIPFVKSINIRKKGICHSGIYSHCDNYDQNKLEQYQ